VLDLYGRYCLAAVPMIYTHTSDKLVNTVQRLFKKEKPEIFHSDQGQEATSFAFNHLLELNGVKQSLSRRGKPKDNSCNESFFSLMKIETNLRELVKTKTEKQVIQIVMR
jgi:transposase InsO family protein